MHLFSAHSSGNILANFSDAPDMTTTPAEESSTFPSDTEETITEVPDAMLTGPETSFETRTTLPGESSTVTTPIPSSSDPETATSPAQSSGTEKCTVITNSVHKTVYRDFPKRVE